jgi:signal transduction histidine kinase
LTYRGEQFIIFALADISDEKRRQALERIFFHDILNLAGGIRGFTEVLDEAGPEQLDTLAGHIRQTADRIIDEILAQRTLLAAESHQLQPQPEGVETLGLLRQVCDIYRVHEAGRGRQLALAHEAESALLVTDPTLLGRVLGNMIKNALEACAEGQLVTVDCRAVDENIEFSVHNPEVIPDTVRLQIFQRSFSTRGAGRGLGTYSMRLLSEEYLGGKVDFDSSSETGTTFFARFPKIWKGA